MIKRIFITSLLSVILAAVCAAQSDPLNFVQTGTATHDMESDDLEAGHAILPIGQEVTITNLESGAQATITITKRIPQTSSRIIDLSSAAAMALAIFDDSAQVTIEAELKRTEPEAPATAPSTPPAVAGTAPADAAAPVPSAPPAASAVPADPAVTAAPAATSTPAPSAPPAASAVPADPAATAPAPAAASVAAAPVPYTVPPPPSGPIPTSEIEPIVPPWEIGHSTPWPVQPSDPWLPELAQPWIGGIERPGANGPARIPAPPPRVAPAPRVAPTSPPRAAPAPVYQGPSVSVVPRMPGPRDNTLYRVQVGAFKTRVNAQEAFNRLLNAGFSPVFEVQGGLTRVQIPWIRGYEVRALGERLYNAGFREVLLREER
ncbi:SPOR domain-containing protein [Treponema primitia]|uniref:SPOR domain-containing protein n=1 Tax=Treponema primitia TaxID=88058 RepID=UPI0002555304|nr:SPOR domain-containing protein [Treponema primitia]